jgi:hypothetical protein
MAEKPTHKPAKARAGGSSGKTEVTIKSGRRLDATTRACAIEVETSGSPQRLRQAAQRLRASGKKQRVLVVPQRDMANARDAMREVGVSGTVRNLSGTKKASVPRQAVSSKTSRRSRSSSPRQPYRLDVMFWLPRMRV